VTAAYDNRPTSHSPVGDFTFWISPWLRPKTETEHQSEHSTLFLVQTED